MKVNILGAAGEIGRSAIQLTTSNSNILMDYGISFSKNEPKFPIPLSSKGLDAILLTHAHLDHSGGIPIFYVSTKPRLITTKITVEISELLIKDLIKLSSYYLPYESLELTNMVKSTKPVNINDQFRLKDLSIQLLNAGHIPGSSMFLIEGDGKKILYTGDFNVINTRMLQGAQIDLPRLDAIIIEGTYATIDHEDRTKVERDFVSSVNEIVSNGGTVVIPAFSVGRAQEILCVLHQYNIKGKIYIDGMAKDASSIFLNNPDFFRDYSLLLEAHKRAIWVNSWSERRKACKEPGIIIAPAGMLKGGNVRFYVKKTAKDQKNAIFLVSYQVEDTPGAMLMKNGVYNFGGKTEKVNARVKWFDFSSHCGNKELLHTIKMADAKKVILVHGEKNKLEKFKRILQDEKITEDIIIPEVGEEISI
ncbi:MAG: MBL fold metallo-hydrolase [Candidatus Verstraetearchaeota archaeon]|nr:MBL fold metallo-hydrolase [Candidatus Verstraetearchaeota archaeon]